MARSRPVSRLLARLQSFRARVEESRGGKESSCGEPGKDVIQAGAGLQRRDLERRGTLDGADDACPALAKN